MRQEAPQTRQNYTFRNAEIVQTAGASSEQYERPPWNFNKVLYIEKESAQESLKQNRWLERHDCGGASLRLPHKNPLFERR